MLQLAVLLVLFSSRCLSHQNHNLTRSQRALTNPQHTADLRPAGGARNSNTPRTSDRAGAGGGGVRAIVTHRGPTTGGGGGGARNSNTPRTCDRRGCLKKDKYVSKYDAAPDAGQGFEKATGRMATLSVHCAKFAVSMQVATDWCSRGISLFLWRGGRNIDTVLLNIDTVS